MVCGYYEHIVGTHIFEKSGEISGELGPGPVDYADDEY